MNSKSLAYIVLFAIAITILHGGAATNGRSLAKHVSAAQRPTQLRLVESYGRRPLNFERNQGQASPGVEFLSRGSGYTLLLGANEAVLKLASRKDPVSSATGSVFHMKLVGASSAPAGIGVDELRGRANYLIGNNPKTWRTNVPQYAKVKYRNVYPGVDLIYYGNQRELEYDLVVAPGSNPAQIRLRFEGAERLAVNKQGDLELHSSSETMLFRKPVIYQESNGQRQLISGGYILAAAHEASFQLGAYDAADRKSVV